VKEVALVAPAVDRTAADQGADAVAELAATADADGAVDGAVDAVAELAAVVRSGFRPYLVLAGGPEGTERPELMRERSAVDGEPSAYVCESFACRRPVTQRDELAAALG